MRARWARRRWRAKISGGAGGVVWAMPCCLPASCALAKPLALVEAWPAMLRPAFLAPVVDLLFPPRCPLCGETLATHGGLCAACWAN
ncbi:double zinc ribbon domain-containing protein, partial [Novosphingobium sp. B-7]|uniref:double zinc ribbon domain-containing protein n=1 Tax=Novosphingobium sp. B-7 TaxID=1298855 RepID=UPI0035270D9C